MQGGAPVPSPARDGHVPVWGRPAARGGALAPRRDGPTTGRRARQRHYCGPSFPPGGLLPPRILRAGRAVAGRRKAGTCHTGLSPCERVSARACVRAPIRHVRLGSAGPAGRKFTGSRDWVSANRCGLPGPGPGPGPGPAPSQSPAGGRSSRSEDEPQA